MRLPLPTTIITGALGVGKTTAVASLLRRKPEGEKWAFLINEFGSLGIDRALLEAAAQTNRGGVEEQPLDGVAVKELAGGCMCCVSAGMLAPAVAMLIRQAKPDRLIIEPSGLGHPAGVLDILQGEHLKSALQIQAVICLVAPADVRGLEGLYLDQVSIADIVVATKADLASPEDLSGFMEWGSALYPPKAAVESIAKGELDMALLDILRTAVLPPKFEELHQRGDPHPFAGHDHRHDHYSRRSEHSHEGHHDGAACEPGSRRSTELVPGKPARFEASSAWDLAAGWVFSPEDTFQVDALLELLQVLWGRVKRVKGVFRTGAKKWVAPTLALSDGSSSEDQLSVELEEVAHRRDSRIEIIVAAHSPSITDRTRIYSKGVVDADKSDPTGDKKPPAAASGLPSFPRGSVEAAVSLAMQGSWDELEALLLSILK
mmetsp:Transcript_7421/g.20957  ORF Transcript_7421/g.20957 Transcript_7421/m.20957 type:complete len:432 (+) Transcript_7421:129-1424(+)